MSVIQPKFTWLDELIYRLTARRWNKLISRVLCRYYSGSGGARLSSEQLHTLAAEFDPTQRPAWRRIQHGELWDTDA